jgi:hypothetical protein
VAAVSVAVAADIDRFVREVDARRLVGCFAGPSAIGIGAESATGRTSSSFGRFESGFMSVIDLVEDLGAVVRRTAAGL